MRKNHFEKYLSCGYSHTVALSESKDVYITGSVCNNKKLYPNNKSFQKIPNLPAIVKVAACGSCTSMITIDGDAYIGGLSSSYNNANAKIHGSVKLSHVKLPQNNKIKQVGVGNNFFVFVTRNGSVFSLGQNSNGMLGMGDKVARRTPEKIKQSYFLMERVERCYVGTYHVFYLTRRGNLFAVGCNYSGQVGMDNGRKDLEVPTRVNLRTKTAYRVIKEVEIKSFSTGYGHSALQLLNGDVYCFGYNSSGELGNGDNSNSHLLQEVSYFKKNYIVVKRVQAMGYNTFFWDVDENVYVCGECSSASIGKLERPSRITKILLPSRKPKIIDISCGKNFMILLESDLQTGFGYGSNRHDQFGRGTFVPKKLNRLYLGFKVCFKEMEYDFLEFRKKLVEKTNSIFVDVSITCLF